MRRGSEQFDVTCRGLPEGHWHCRHGHVIDCPDPMTCPPIKVDDQPLTWVVAAGKIIWLLASEAVARSQVQVLQDGGARDVMYRRALPPLMVDLLLARTPDDVHVEDCR